MADTAQITPQDLPEREVMEFDVCIVGAGVAGLSTAIRLKQLANEAGDELNVVVLEKGSEVGAHILSGAVIDPIGLNALIPDWQEKGAPVNVPVTEDQFLYLREKSSLRLPNFLMPPLMSNHGNYVVSLANVSRWLAEQAEALGVDIFPGFAASELLYDEAGAVIGVATGDMGIGKDGAPKDSYTRGMALHAKYVVIAEGVRGSLAKQAIAKFKLDEGREPQKYGLGIKELWQVKPENHKAGRVQHAFGWPLDNQTGGGAFIYHLDDSQVYVGYVVHLNYSNPYLSPFEEFQRFKLHPKIRPLLEGGKRLSYGARAITEGGFQSVPKLSFKGGVLVGCSAGFVNVPRIKGSHNAILSGILAAEHLAAAIKDGRQHDEVTSYQAAYETSEIAKDLKRVRNVKPLWSRFGTLAGIAIGGFDMWCNTLGFSLFGTQKHGKADHECLKPASECEKITYPKPDGVITFDRLSSVFMSNTNHEEDQPAHLRLNDRDLQKSSELNIYAGPSSRYCPAGVYEWVNEGNEPRFVINAQNCVHCKTCDIKDPNQNITWVPPEGAGGPNYPNM